MKLGTLRWLGLPLLALVLVAAGCTGDEEGVDTQAATDPVRGGTLRIVNEVDVDYWDTGSAYTVIASTFARLHARTLYSWDSSLPAERANHPVPDLAAGPPTISADRLTYTFKLRTGARYAPPVNREVRAEDFIYAVERQFDKEFPSPNPYNIVIKGATEFSEGRAEKISGMRAVDDTTLEIALVQPASDFLSIMAIPFFAPVPKEHASRYRPGTDYSKAYVGAGPYYLTEWTAGKSAVFVRNPNWDPASDPLRKAYVDRVEVRIGVDQNAAQQAIESDDAHLSLDLTPPRADLERLASDPTLSRQFVAPLDGCTKYLTLQTDNGPTAKLLVRQAINYAIDREAIVLAVGGRLAAEPATTILAPPLVGYQRYDLYPTPKHRGDPGKARQLLAQAGYPSGVTINMVSSTSGPGPSMLTSLQASLERAGITLNPKTYPGSAVFDDSLLLPSKAAEHQIGMTGWCPDYPGNGARSVIGALLDGRNINPQGNLNHGNYNNPKTNQLIDRALTASDQAAQADRQAMQDAAWAPLTYDKQAKFWSSRVKNFRYSYWVANADLANLWLVPNTP
jgi:peptide/nickel transport system substrate-binding protein